MILELALMLSLLMAEEKESMSITKLSASSAEYWYAFMWSETEILWVPMFFCSDSRASREEESPEFYKIQTHGNRATRIKNYGGAWWPKIEEPEDPNFQWNSWEIEKP